MKKKKKYLAVALVIIMTVSMLTGCFKAASPQNLLDDMADNMSDLDSMEGTFELDTSMSYPSGSVLQDNMDLDYTFDLKKNLSHFIGTRTQGVSDDKNHQRDMECYQQLDDGAYTLYSHGFASNSWESFSGKIDDSKVDGIDGLGDLNLFADDFERKGETSVDGRDCYQLEGEIEGDSVGKLLAGCALQGMIALPGGGEEDVPIPCTICIDKKDLRLASISMDLEPYMESTVHIEDFHTKIFTVKIQVKNYNRNVDLAIPQEALDADSSEDD